MASDSTAIWISLASASIAALALGWNIYRDVLLKPKMKVVFGKRILVSHGVTNKPTINLSVTNMGPGRCKIDGIYVRMHSPWLRIRKKVRLAAFLPDYLNPGNPRIPHSVDLGDTVNFFWEYNKDRLGLLEYNQIGVSDSFGRVHWAPKSEYLETVVGLGRDFEKKTP